MRVAALRIAAAACAAVGLAAGAGAAVNAWTSTGPAGAKIASVAVSPSNPQVIYAGAISLDGATNVYKSTDGGSAWTRLAPQVLTSNWTHAVEVAVAPDDPNVVYVGGNGLLKSTDGGATWQAISGVTDSQIKQIVIDPSNADLVRVLGSSGLYTSIDAGASWNASAGLSTYDIYTLTLDPSDSSVIWAAGDFVYLSTDGGATWQEKDIGLPEYPLIHSIAVDPADSSRVFLGGAVAVWTTIDGGDHWTLAGNVHSADYVTSLLLDPSVPSTLYAGTRQNGLFFSSDAGSHWQPLPDLCTSSVYWISAAAGDDTHLLAAGTGGFFQSTNSGSSWSPSNVGLHSTDAVAVAVDPSNPQTIYAGTYGGGVFRSTDGGATWSDACGNIGDSNVMSLAISQAHPSTLFAGTETGIYKTIDGGSRWSLLGLEGFEVDAVAVDPADDSRVYVGTFSWTDSRSFYFSADGGQSWGTAAGYPGPVATWAIAIDPSNTSILYAAVSSPSSFAGDVYKSTDSGAHWQATHVTTSEAVAVAVDPAAPNVVYAGGRYGIYRSPDKGASWSIVTPASYPGPIVFDPADSSIIYAAEFGGLLVSRDGGTSWFGGNPSISGIAGAYSDSIAVDDSVSPARLHVGILDAGVYSIDPVVPEVDSVDPTSGSTNGGTAITITGKNFMPGASVRMAGTTVSGLPVHFVNDSTLMLDSTPPGPAGPADVTVVNPTAVARTGNDLFTYECMEPFTATVSGDTTICQYQTTPISARLTGFGPWTLHWSDGIVQIAQTANAYRFVSPDATAVYTLDSVTDSSGCGAGTPSGSATVTVKPAPVEPVITAPLSMPPESIRQASVPVAADVSYLWSVSGGNGGFLLDGDGTNQITFEAGAPGFKTSLSIYENVSNGCSSPTGHAFVQTDFLDVPPGHVFHDDVIAIARPDITHGCDTFGHYCPNDPVTRAQMAIFLLRGEHGGDYAPPSATGTVFEDVSADSFAADFIEQLAAEGITQGCGGGNYCPNDPVTRAQMAIFLLRVEHGADYVPPPATGTVFEDVPADAFAAAYIEQLSSESITHGCDATHYCPNDSVTRGQMAAFLRRTFGL